MSSAHTTTFALGQIVITPAALDVLSQDDIVRSLRRHAGGDWGDVCEEDCSANDQALLHGDRLLSVYHTADHRKFWIITEWDRSVTTILLPEDY